MSTKEHFKKHINEGYTFKNDFIILGGAMIDEEPVEGALVKIPLKTLNRHGLIAGATGTGKTKSMQVMAEQLSLKGIPCLLMDIKGDLSGLAQQGEPNDHIVWRHGAIGVPYEPEKMPVELMSISEQKGVRLRATVSEFGPVLLAKMLDLNDTQEGILSILFKFCDDNTLPLLDLKDLRKTLQFINDEGKDAIQKEYGQISSSSISTIMRKVVELEQQGADLFFGEKSFDVTDFLHVNKKGRGQVSIIRLNDIQNRPKLFSTFMMGLLAEVYETFPEAGDADKPKLCIFIDEAHLMFKEASDALLDQIEIIIKLIRSKGVGIYFVTQLPTDVPDDVLSQLGLKIQHALRAFTAKDRKAIKQTAQNYPLSEFYKTDEILTSMGTGVAMVTGLNEKGIPTPLAVTLLQAPKSRMGVLTKQEIDFVVDYSLLNDRYKEEIDRESAYEILEKRLTIIEEEELREKRRIQKEKEAKAIEKSRRYTTKRKSVGRPRKSTADKAVDTFVKTAGREIIRGVFSVLGLRR
ncbi:MAG: helicase HerA-like domain-containing protein [Putridiphycobacter sp.]|nr:helicase HerA-like domain-containing protein [Putridiphycobacter sp.]